MKFIAKFDTLSQGEDQYPVVNGVVDCPMALGRELGLEPFVEGAAGNGGSTNPPVDPETEKDAELHHTPADKAIAEIGQIQDVAFLREVIEREKRNTKKPGGRSTVIAAAEARIAALDAGDGK